MTEELVPACDIQEGCNLPQGHMGICEANGSSLARTPHDFPADPETLRSGKLTYEVCRMCFCVREHPVHGWTPQPASPQGEESADTPSIDELLARVCQVCPEPSLMDMEDGAHSMTLLLRRAHVLASLHQAKQMERIAEMLAKPFLLGAAPMTPRSAAGVYRHIFVEWQGHMHYCRECGLERAHPVHA